MPTFGDFETIGEPVSVAELSGHVSTVWRARKSGSDSDATHAVKCFAPHRRKTGEGEAEDALDKDRGLEFLEGVKQLKKAEADGGRCLCPTHAFGFADEGAWYVTDFYPRGTLKAWIARRGSVDNAALRQVVSSIVTGCLALKRSRGYSHGNLKAANVFLVGKPQPLRKTPLALADAYPSAPLQLARLVGEEKRTVDDLLHQVMEVQDLRALGEILLQLVEGRLVSSAYDYNYPVAASPAWDRLGRDADRWRDLTNRLLDPRLSLEKLSLESLARDFRPSDVNGKLPIIVGVGAVVCLAVGGIVWKLVSRPSAPPVVGVPSTDTNRVTVAVSPVIASQPAEQVVTEGGNARFSVSATGTGPLNYQWRREGANVPGATGATLNLAGVTMSQAGAYTVVVGNSVGSVTSAVARLTVNLRTVSPVIASQPAEQTVTEGETVRLSVSATGTGPLSYQWRREGANVPGATGATLSLPNVTMNQAGGYTVVVGNSAGSVTSTVARLTVSLRPVAPVLTSQPTEQTVTEGENVRLSVNATGTGPLNYQWRREEVNLPGATSATLNLTGVTTNQAGVYAVVVGNAVGSVTSAVARLTVSLRPVSPVIASQPAEQVVTEGGNARFSVSATGTGPLNYQWRREGANVPGATGATLNLAGVTMSQAGAYTVVVGNSVGSVTSAVARLSVNAAVIRPSIAIGPVDQSVTEGGNANFTVRASGTEPLRYQWQRNGANALGATSAMLSLTEVTTEQAGGYTVVVSNTGGSVTSGVARLTVNLRPVAPVITIQPVEQTVAEGEPVRLSVSATGTVPLTYQWRREGANVSGGTGATLSLSRVTTNQAGNYTVVVGNSVGSVTSAVARLTVIAQLESPRISPNTLEHRDIVEVEISAPPGAAIYYTLNRSEPTTDSIRYNGPFKLITTTTVRARAFAAGYKESPVVAATFTVTPTPLVAIAPPTVAVEAGKSTEVLLKGSGPPGAKWNYEVETHPTRGKLGAISGATVTYTANPNSSGPDSFTFRASDGAKQSPSARVNIEIQENVELRKQRETLDGLLTSVEKVFRENQPFDFWSDAVNDYIGTNIIILEREYEVKGWMSEDRMARIKKLKSDERIKVAVRDGAKKVAK